MLLLTLLVPILAACSGLPGSAASVPTSEPAAAAPETDVATVEPADDTGASELEVTSVPSGEAPTEATEEPAAAVTEDDSEPSASDAVSPVGNVLRVNFGSEPDNVDPQQASFVGEITYIMLNYLPLMTFDKDLKPVPGAAENVEISEDGKTFTFKLRPNQTYSDGEPLTAANFEYGWKRLCDPLVSGEYVTIGFPIVGCEEFYSALANGAESVDEAELQRLRDAVGVEAVDDETLVITLKQAAPYFLNVAALWVGAPVRQDLVEEGGELWWADPAFYIGNGPFQLVQWDHGSYVRFERNENYVLAKPKVEAIEGPMISDGNVAFEAYRAGEFDIGGFPAEELETIENDPELSAQRVDVPGSCTSYLGFNTAEPPFDNKQVRQAFAQAIDRDAWVRDVLSGLGKKALSFIPPGIPGHDPNETRFDFDPAAARQTLEASGYDTSQEIKLAYAASPINKAYNEYLASMLQSVLGVTITLDPVDPTVYSSLFKRGETTPTMFTLGWCADYLDPQDWLSLVFRTGGIAAERIRWSNAKFDELTLRADAMPLDDPERMELYMEAQRILVEEAPVAFMTHSVDTYLVQPWVKNLHPTPLDYFPGFFDLSSIEIVTE